MPAPHVKQHPFVTFSQQKKMSVLSKRIMARVIEQIQDDDLQFRDCYVVNVISLMPDSSLAGGTGSLYTRARAALDELREVYWNFESLDNKEFHDWHLLDSSQGQRNEVVDGKITLVLNPQLAPYFLNLVSDYSTYELAGYMELQSWYSMRFFEILAAFRTVGRWEVSVEEFRGYMDCGLMRDKFGRYERNLAGDCKIKFPRTFDLVQNVILRAQQELASTACAFDFEMTNRAQQWGRPKVTGFIFTLHGDPQTKKIPVGWTEHTHSAKAFTRLREYRVSDRNILLYTKAITLAGLNTMLDGWDKELGSLFLNSEMEQYCNAVFISTGIVATNVRLEAQKSVVHCGEHLLPPCAILPPRSS